MNFVLNLFKKSFTVLLFCFLFSAVTQVNAQSSYECGSSSDGTMFCDTSYSQLTWKGTNDCLVTFIKNTDGVYECTETTRECATGNFPNIMNSINEIFSGVTQVDVKAICDEIETTNGQPDPEVINENVKFEEGLTTALLDGTGYMFQTPPVEPFRIYAKRTIDEVMAKINILDSVNAQTTAETIYWPGPGYNLLSPIQSIWNALRNVAYGFLIIIVFFISLMILFRRSLNGDQVVSLMNSLPSLILSMVLITFSYGISGVFLDIIPIGSNFIQYVLVGNPNSPGYNTIWNSELIRTNSNLVFYNGTVTTDGQITCQEFAQNFGITDPEEFCDLPDVLDPDRIAPGRNAIQIDSEYMSIWQIWGTANPSIFNALRSPTNNFNFLPDSSILENSGVIQNVASGFGNVIGRNADSDANTPPDNIVQGAAGMLIDLVFSFAALVATFRLFMSLLRAYLTLILLPAVSPIIFLLAGIPSLTSNMIGMFVRSMLSSALAFVAVYALFLVVIILSYETFVQNTTLIPPLLGYTWDSNLNVNGSIIKSLAAYGIFLMAPIVPSKIQEALQAGGDSAFGEAVAQGTQQGIGTAMMLGNAVSTQIKKLVSPKDA